MSEERMARPGHRIWLLAIFKSTKLAAIMKIVKFGKPMITAISLLASALLYGITYGPWFGIGIVAMIFVHEMGHIIALRIKGYETHGPVFIPFLGAAIFVPKFAIRDTEAYVGYGGPLLGTAGAAMCLAAYLGTGSQYGALLILAYSGAFLNLFNLVPLSPLDGGRITQAVGSPFKYVGFAVLLAYSLTLMQPAIILIWILCLPNFSWLNIRWTKPGMAAALGCFMALLMCMGYGDQPILANCVDCALALFVIVGELFIYSQNERRGETPDSRPYPRTPTRVKWLM